MIKKIFFVLLLLVFFGDSVYASIEGWEELKINFTDEKDATAKATWFEPDKINVTENGLGWDGEQNARRDGWIQTIPLAVGLSWRPAQYVNVTVEIKPEIEVVTLPNGQTYTFYRGYMFLRYSPDGKHWSSWQAMNHPKPQDHTTTKRKFTAIVIIPQREREEYMSYMEKYWKLNVPWISDEEAMVEWILLQDPKFFDKYIPFVGYLQFLYENSFPGSQRITEFHAVASFELGGKAQDPKDKNVYKERLNIPWRFKVK